MLEGCGRHLQRSESSAYAQSLCEQSLSRGHGLSERKKQTRSQMDVLRAKLVLEHSMAVVTSVRCSRERGRVGRRYQGCYCWT